jgi:hypothetical protein
LIITHYSLLSLFITCNLSLHTNCSLLIAHYSLLLCSITIS